MAIDLVETVLNCLTEADQTLEPSPIFKGLKTLKDAYSGSGYDPGRFVANKGLDTATDGVISYRKMTADREYDCLALNLNELISAGKARALLNKASERGVPAQIDGEIYLIDAEKLLIGISLN